MTIDRILDCLNRERIRATYGAVGEVIGIPAIGVGAALGKRSQRASWVVNAGTGKPAGYGPDQIHADLRLTSRIIRTGDELRRLCAEYNASRSAPRTCPYPGVFAHADWSTDPKKRWCAIAVLDADGRYRSDASEPVGDLDAYFRRLRERAGPGAAVFCGFDFPIGLPARYGHKAGLKDFPDALLEFGSGRWCDFYSPAPTEQAISIRRPFYPQRPGGAKKHHLVSGLDLQNTRELYRSCDLHPDRGPAEAIFWLIGPKQVGRAAITGWRDLLAPAMRSDSPPSIWPFDGRLTELLARPGVVVAETYPAEVYRHLDLGISGNDRSKRCQTDRASDAGALVAWARANRVRLTQRLHAEIVNGFDGGADGEDRFDAVVGLFGMLDVVLGNRPSGEPDDDTTRIEGWILGQPSVGGKEAGGDRAFRDQSVTARRSMLPTKESSVTHSAAFPCPIRGCTHVFRNTRGGWDAHVASQRRHPEWHSELTDPEGRKRKFKDEYGDWFRR